MFWQLTMAFENRLFHPAGVGPAIWFQPVPEEKAGKNRLHLDLYPTGRDNALSIQERVDTVHSGASGHGRGQGGRSHETH